MKTAARSKNLRPQDIVAIIDTREQTPVDLSPLASIRKGLKTGDYSVVGYEKEIAIERKSLQDFIGCCGSSRDRFEQNIERLQLYRYRAIVVEGSWSTIELKQYRGGMHPNSILGSALGWALDNVSILMAGTPALAGKMIARMLWIAANRLHRSKDTSTNELELIANPDEQIPSQSQSPVCSCGKPAELIDILGRSRCTQCLQQVQVSAG